MDIDIDLADRNQLLDVLEHRKAKLKTGTPHNTGVYFCEIPHNPLNNVATLDYDDAHSRGYFKIDLLNVNIYKDVQNNTHMDELVNTEPMWNLLQYEEVTKNLFHIANHGIVMRVLKPKNIDELAMALAIIRPAKKHLLNKSWDEIKEEVWKPPTNNEYHFKKSHSYSYAMAVIVHLNLFCEKIIKESS